MPLSTNENDRSIAEAYRTHAAAGNLKLRALAVGHTPAETDAYADLGTYTIADVYSTAPVVIGDPVAMEVAGVGSVWSLPIRSWALKNFQGSAVSVAGLVVVDELRARVLYLHQFAEVLVIGAGLAEAFDLDLWFDTHRG